MRPKRYLFSDLGDHAFIPMPEKEYTPVHFLKIGEAAKKR